MIDMDADITKLLKRVADELVVKLKIEKKVDQDKVYLKLFEFAGRGPRTDSEKQRILRRRKLTKPAPNILDGYASSECWLFVKQPHADPTLAIRIWLEGEIRGIRRMYGYGESVQVRSDN